MASHDSMNPHRSPILQRFSLQSITSLSPTATALDRESAYLSTTRLLTRVRFLFSVIILAGAVAVIGCSGDALHQYNHTHLSSQWWLPLWPNHFDLRPTVVLLTCSGIVAGITLIYIIAALIPSPRSHHTLTLNLATLTTLLSLTATITALAYVSQRPRGTSPNNNPTSTSVGTPDTLESWTCKWSHGTVQAGAPESFKRICDESHAGFDLMAMLVAFEMLRLGTVAVGWYVEWKARKARQGEDGGDGGSGRGSLRGLKEGHEVNVGEV